MANATPMMMKKVSFLFLTVTMLLVLFSCICFANGNSFAGEDSDVNADKDYPEFGLHLHSWITGFGSTTIAHTQQIDLVTGKVIKQLDTQCNYEDPPIIQDTQGI